MFSYVTLQAQALLRWALNSHPNTIQHNFNQIIFLLYCYFILFIIWTVHTFNDHAFIVMEDLMIDGGVAFRNLKK